MKQPRSIETILVGQPASDGAGVALTRVFSGAQARRLDPFLMLDEFASETASDYIAGFPSHPHRGFETITVMLQGKMRHKDSAGNEGLIESGGIQWMTAGRGVIHSEMPEQSEGLMQGFQLWLNLPAAEKMIPPGYNDLPAAAIPEITRDGVTVRLFAGEFDGVTGPIQRGSTAPFLAVVTLAPGATLDISLPAGHTAFAYAYEGSARAVPSARAIQTKELALFTARPGEDGVRLEASAQGAKFLIGAGKPLREPIVQYGPFVMNSREEIEQAMRDYQGGVLA